MHPAIHEYLQENWGRFPAEELRAELLTAGYPADAVDEEIRLVSSSGKLSTETAGAPTPKLLTRSKVLDWFIGFFGIFIFGFVKLILLDSLLLPATLNFFVLAVLYLVVLVLIRKRYPYIFGGLLGAAFAYVLWVALASALWIESVLRDLQKLFKLRDISS